MEATKSVLNEDEKGNSILAFINVSDKNTAVLWEMLTNVQRHVQASACLESPEDVASILLDVVLVCLLLHTTLHYTTLHYIVRKGVAFVLFGF